MTHAPSTAPEPANAPEPATGAPDDAIVARVCAGDVDAFATIMRRYNQRLFRAARSIVKDDDEAEDVLQEAYVQAYCHLGSFEGRAKLSTWLTRIVVHEALRRTRLQRRQPAGLEGHDDVDLAASPEQIASSNQMARALEGAIDQLPDDFRTVFMLRVIERLDVSSTAACLGIKEATVKTRLHRARLKLQEALAHQTHDAFPLVHRFLGERCNRVVARVLQRLGQPPS